MSQTPVHKKLQLKSGLSVMVMNQPREYAQIIGSLPEGIELSDGDQGQVDFVHLFIKDQSELNEYIEAAIKAVKYDGLLWISYPKGSSNVETDINRDILWDLLLEKGIRPVKQISIDSTWSAIRFRPSERVGH
jgi:hypothetical protein